MKKCLHCEKEKDETLFEKSNRTKSGITSQCKVCYNERRKSYISKNRERTRENYNRYYRKNNKRILKHNRKKTVKYREINRERIGRYHKNYYKAHAVELRLRALEYAKSPEYIEKRRKRVREYAKRESEKFKIRARKILYTAIKVGHLIRPSKCEICLIDCKPHGHHKDYSQPLEVQWLCKKCHNHQHNKLLDLKQDQLLL